MSAGRVGIVARAPAKEAVRILEARAAGGGRMLVKVSAKKLRLAWPSRECMATKFSEGLPPPTKTFRARPGSTPQDHSTYEAGPALWWCSTAASVDPGLMHAL